MRESDPKMKVMNMGRDVQVLMYSLSNPTEDDTGTYTCRAERATDAAEWQFELAVGEAEHEEMDDETKPEYNTEATTFASTTEATL